MESKNSQNLQGKSGFMTFILSMVPGAGHMYLGLMNKGLVMMACFMFITFFIGWINLPFLGFVVPVLWFYSVFDAMNIRKGTKVEDDLNMDNFLPRLKMNIDGKKIGYGLIVLGGLILFQKIFSPMIKKYLTWEQRDMIQTFVVAGIFIIGGIKLLDMNKDGTEDGEE